MSAVSPALVVSLIFVFVSSTLTLYSPASVQTSSYAVPECFVSSPASESSGGINSNVSWRAVSPLGPINLNRSADLLASFVDDVDLSES